MLFDRQLLYLALVFAVDRVSCLAMNRSGSADPRTNPSTSPNLDITPSPVHEATVPQASDLAPFLTSDSSVPLPDGSSLTSTYSKVGVGDSAADSLVAPKSAISFGQSQLQPNLGYSTPSSTHPTTTLVTGTPSSPKHELRKRSPAAMASDNALSVLFSALPSDIADPLRTDFSSFIATYFTTASASVQPYASVSGSAQVSESSGPASRSITIATESTASASYHAASSSRYLSKSASSSQSSFPSQTSSTSDGFSTSISSSQKSTHTPLAPWRTHTRSHTTSSTTHTTSSLTTTPTSSHTSHITMSRPTAASANATIAPPTPGSSPAHPLDNAAIVGLAAGLGAGAVMAALGGFYIWRRKRQGKPLWGPRGSQRSTGSSNVFPRVAWLYDPPRSPTQDADAQNLIPNPPRPGSVEMAAAPPQRPSGRASSPLLPEIRIAPDDGEGYLMPRDGYLREEEESEDENPRRSGGRQGRPMM